jgi:hypothetical protein
MAIKAKTVAFLPPDIRGRANPRPIAVFMSLVMTGQTHLTARVIDHKQVRVPVDVVHVVARGTLDLTVDEEARCDRPSDRRP